MLSRKLVRPFFSKGSSSERTVVVTLLNHSTFSPITKANNTRDHRNFTSLCPSLSISFPQLKLDSGHERLFWAQPFGMTRSGDDHLFRHNPINVSSLLAFTSSLSIANGCSRTPSSGSSTSRQYHTLTRPLPVCPTSCRTLTTPALVHNKYFTTLRLKKRESNQTCLTMPIQRVFSSQGKSDQSENNNNPNNDTKEPPVKSTITIKDGLQTRTSVKEFLDNLTEEQKGLLYHSLNVDVLRDKYEGHLGSSKSESHHYLSRFGRPTAAVGEEPTGTLCEVPPKWLHTRLGKDNFLDFLKLCQLWAIKMCRHPCSFTPAILTVKCQFAFIFALFKCPS